MRHSCHSIRRLEQAQPERDRRGTIEPNVAHAQGDKQHGIGVETQTHLAHVSQTLNEQTSADEKHHG